MHPEQVWPGQPVSLRHRRGALPACSAAAEPVEAVLPGASRQPRRAAHAGKQPVSPSCSPAGSSPGLRAGRGAQSKPGQGVGCAPTFSKSWEPLARGSAGKEAPWELNVGVWLHIAVPQTLLLPCRAPSSLPNWLPLP